MALCRHCNAPLPHGQIRCSYCGAANDIDLSGRHYYTSHPPQAPRTCPICHIAMETLDVSGGSTPFFIERCSKCLGLFFDPGELDALVRQSVPGVYTIDQTGLAALRKNAPPESPVQYRPCPVCGKLMNRENFGERSGIIVDRCRDHGIFLDGGELLRIQQWVRLGGVLQAEQQKSNPIPQLHSPREPEESAESDSIQQSFPMITALLHFLRNFI